MALDTESRRAHAREAARRYYRKNSRECLARSKSWVVANMPRHRAYMSAYQIKDRARNPIKYLLYQAKSRAKAKGLVFNLKIADLKTPLRCPVLGIKLKYGMQSNGKNDLASASLDRLNNRRGYTKGNVRVISRRANELKRDGTLKEFKAIARYMEFP